MPDKICVACGFLFSTRTCTIACSPECSRKQSNSVRRVWHNEHKEERARRRIELRNNGGKERARNKARTRLRMLNGRTLPDGECKRPPTENCEVCGQAFGSRHIAYHHWDDEMPAMGMWLCRRCHVIAEGVDNNLHQAYISKKVQVEKEYAIEQLAKIGIPEEALSE